NDQINSMLFEATLKDLSPPLLSPFALSMLVCVVSFFILFTILWGQYRKRQSTLVSINLLEEHNAIQQRLLQQNQIIRECFEIITSPISPVMAMARVSALTAEYLQVARVTILTDELTEELFDSCEKRLILWPKILPEKGYPELAQKLVETKCVLLCAANENIEAPLLQECEIKFLQDNHCQLFYARKLLVNHQIWGFLWFTDDKNTNLENERLAALDMLGNTIEIFLERIEISRRMEAEAQFKQTIFQASPIPLLLFDRNKNIQMYNAQAQKIVGGTAGTMSSPRRFELLCSEKRSTDASPVQKTLHTGQAQLMRMKLLGRWYDISTMPIFKNGRIVNVLQAMVDQTDMIQSERHYRETSELFQSVLDTVPCQVFVKDYDDDGRYIVVNKYLQRFYNI
ncbi:MAG: PAS domain-containing protein, partial [Victivallaceae bacterium]